jgi:GDPmannose 4,6-dehydratase
MDALRDWGHARDYVEMQWLMLQQDKPEDFVIATGRQYSVRRFVELAARELGIEIAWQGEGVHERGVIASISGDKAPGVAVGQPIVAVDPQYFRPTEVETLLGDPSRARDRLGWEPRTPFETMVQEMVAHDLDTARRHKLLASHGYNVAISLE